MRRVKRRCPCKHGARRKAAQPPGQSIGLAHGAQIEVRPIADLCRPMAEVKAAQP
jgi:hypothetical protein